MEQTLIPPGVAVVGAGFLGSRLIAALRQGGTPVSGIDPVAPADFACSAAGLPENLAPGAFQLIFCCMATHGGDAAAYRACYPGTVRALLGRFPAARLVFCSSLSVYGVRGGGRADENAPTRRDSARADMLLEAEAAVSAAGGVIARLAPLYGETRCELLRRHLAGESRLPGPETRVLNYLHVQDAVSALLLLAGESHAHGPYNVCGESLPHAQAYRLLQRCTGVPAAADCSPPGRRGASDLLPDCGRLRALGWAPRFRLQDFFRAHSPA